MAGGCSLTKSLWAESLARCSMRPLPGDPSRFCPPQLLRLDGCDIAVLAADTYVGGSEISPKDLPLDTHNGAAEFVTIADEAKREQVGVSVGGEHAER